MRHTASKTAATVTATTNQVQIGNIDRAKRFEIEVPVLYRPKGTSEWRQGKSKNISRTGVMFTAEDPIPVGTELEIHIVLNGQVQAAPEPRKEAEVAPVACQGEVVRSVLVPWPEVFPTVGARFSASSLSD